jgi:parvulin-like peptidyl-prolyl isomerase
MRFHPAGLLLLLVMANCGKHVPEYVNDLPSIEGLTEDPPRTPIPQADHLDSVSISHIRCSYKGALGAGKRLKRSRAQAKMRINHLLRLARSQEHDFADLARNYSEDGSTSIDGGDLGVIERHTLHPNIEEAAFKLGLGQVSDVVESPHGFHIIMRHLPTEVQTAEILITYDGAKRYTPREYRTASQAEALAKQIWTDLQKGADFELLAKQYSDLPNYNRGGYLPIFAKGKHRQPKFEEIVWKLKKGQISKIEETVTGFHIVKRLPLKRVQIRRIDIKKPKPTKSSAPIKQRTYEEAKQLAYKIYNLVLQKEADFASLASKYSEGPAKNKGGAVDRFGRGGPIPYPIEEAAFALSHGQVSNVIETEKAFHIIKRIN